jgi:sporulation protein YlmC with PRC-barrel domain
MQRSSLITGYQLRAKDGTIGSIDDLLFDESHFGVRWVVVDTGTWLPGRKVLLPPSVLGAPDVDVREYPVDLDKDQIEDAPGLASDQPVSRQMETGIYGYYGWTPYWYGGFGYPALGGMVPAGAMPVTPPAWSEDPQNVQAGDLGDPQLRSANEVTGYNVEATDGGVGHIEDVMIDEKDWVIRYLMVDTKNWWPGKKVLISPDWRREIVWSEQRIYVDVTRDKVKNAPEFDPTMTVDRDYEDSMFAHFGFRPYW